MNFFEYPYNGQSLLRKKKKYKRDLMEKIDNPTKVKVAVMCGSTVNDLVDMLELFLLSANMVPTFYIGDYSRYYEQIMYSDEELKNFDPDIIYIHTSYRNIKYAPNVESTKLEVESNLSREYRLYEDMWEKVKKEYNAIVVQNNFEQPPYQFFGNSDISAHNGMGNYIHSLNSMFYEYVQKNSHVYIQDIHYLAARAGLEKWHDSKYWYEYKYAMHLFCIPDVAYSLFSIIKSLYGKNYKGVIVDADNTLWGGIVGEDGADNLLMSKDTSIGHSYFDWQDYLKHLTKRGILIGIVSKNNEQDLLLGLSHEDNVMNISDYTEIVGNWEPKDKNIERLIKGLDLSENHFLYVDDSVFERELIKNRKSKVKVVEANYPEDFLRVINEGRYFEMTLFSEEDKRRNQQYKNRKMLSEMESNYKDYDSFLRSLDMKAKINIFNGENRERILQLINKTNQFNLTTRRYGVEKISDWLGESTELLYGSLEDKFTSHGIVSVAIVKFKKKEAEIDTFLMSCRVLKRGLEHAMIDEIVKVCKRHSVEKLKAMYIESKRNMQVRDLYESCGFSCDFDEENVKNYTLEIENYKKLNENIEVI